MVPPTLLLVNLPHRWELATVMQQYWAVCTIKAGWIRGHAMPTQSHSATICFPLYYTSILSDAGFPGTWTRRHELIIVHTGWWLCSFPSFHTPSSSCLVVLRLIHRSANWHVTSASSANFKLRYVVILFAQGKNLTSGNEDRAWSAMMWRTMGGKASALMERLSPRANKSLLYSDLVQCVI